MIKVLYKYSFLVAFCAFSLLSLAQNKTPKNIILILSDDHAYQAISAYNDRLATIAPTPNIDKLANEGIRFDRSYVGNSICAPSRATILTGKHSHKNGVLTLKESFDGSQPTIASILQNAGYQTAIIGKWHLKSEPVGFSFWDVLIDQGDYYNSDFRTAKGTEIHKGYVTDVITDKAINWLEKGRDKKQPFMMIVGNKAPHANWIPPLQYLNTFDNVTIPEPQNLFDTHDGHISEAKQIDMTLDEMPMGWYCEIWSEPKNVPNIYEDYGGKLWQRAYGRLSKEEKQTFDSAFKDKNEAFAKANLKGNDLIRWKYQRIMQNYLGCIKSVDDNVGRLMAYLKENKLDENTLVIYTSDQGLFLGEHGFYDKRLMYEEAFRTPLIAYCPSIIKGGKVSNDLVQNIDYAPTILDYAGVQIPKEIQGKSLLPVMTQKKVKNWRKSLYYQYYDFPGGHNIAKHEGVRTDRYKLIHYYDLNKWEFYDLKKDPTEMKSQYISPEYAKDIALLKIELAKLRKQYQVPSLK
ncbi:sulfatase [Flavobacterium sp. NG2]|uniref:sulfatase family protein n=1 Tax=Flavobacterium sp. NG2 TaxID=3097547 RepID=UPI002A80EBA7|nr:sulfatase [Flavobacterium sp. NG2]WPR71119.1 sulfatase [Flavobacterium sp. NG2]